ncbi:MAG TPA: SAM-dependent chlorinase/fluorinase [Deltaproteobacteria bacterium]|nr:SAM-dependent chlorinase/fluorinase [Deltaproteobacteria bacterium]HPR54218.1 SAM-dependent chlorinase/fluorinase [Deltaproteobacteria bacterium]HXK45871.1 SAM-dependent chlorinase/fluorinase [Deltaproteobacteria bacterium]
MTPCVTFLSDFGLRDAYVAQVKAVLLSQVPEARIVDISHEMDPFNIISAGWLLATSYRYFPAGTVHLAVVDPGVGTDRAVLEVRKEGHVFVGPDNGLFSFLYPAEEVVEVTWRPAGSVSSTFHGRDIFAPLAVKLLTGHGLGVAGRPRADPVCLDVHAPMVVHIDGFGNVITNIPCSRLGSGAAVDVNGTTVDSGSGTFADIPFGGLGLVCGSAGTIEIAANRARASDMVGACVGMTVSIVP